MAVAPSSSVSVHLMESEARLGRCLVNVTTASVPIGLVSKWIHSSTHRELSDTGVGLYESGHTVLADLIAIYDQLWEYTTGLQPNYASSRPSHSPWDQSFCSRLT